MNDSAHHNVTAPAETGSVRLRKANISLNTEVGKTFITDCARNTEGLMPDADIKIKYELSDGDWDRLADNALLLKAVRAERDRRVVNGDAAREAAQRHFAKAPNVLGDILTDESIQPRHRIEAAKELRQVAGNGPETAPGSGEKFIIRINFGDQKLEKEITPVGRSLLDDGE